MHPFLSRVGGILLAEVERETALWAIFTILTLFFFTLSAVVGNMPVMATL